MRRDGPSSRDRSGFAPSIHLRDGDTVLDLQCSVRDTASDCAQAAIELIDELRSAPAGDSAQP